MIIKKFLGKTEEEALENAKKELGSGIVTLNVKSVKPKGIFGAFRAKQIEVTVALEEEKDVTKQSVLSMGGNTEQRASSGTAEWRKQELASQNIEKKLDNLQALLENQFQTTEKIKEESIPKEPVVLKQPKEIPKQEIPQKETQKESAFNGVENLEQNKFVRLLYNTMIDNEVDERYANQMLEDIDKQKNPNVPFDYILANIYQKTVLKFGRADGITPAKNGPKVVLFIGPTGVGKTTTIAKIASSYTGTDNKVALLTADTYRIAAAEQLRTYANILEVPFRIIYTGEELAYAVADFKDYDYIFVDTAGHSYQNEEQLNKMKYLFQVLEGIVEYQAFLVLSATTKYGDLLKISESYKTVTNYQLIFTKLDETTAFGNLLNVRMYTDAPIAYVTTGQNVPDDIQYFNPQKAVKQLLGGRSEI